MLWMFKTCPRSNHQMYAVWVDQSETFFSANILPINYLINPLDTGLALLVYFLTSRPLSLFMVRWVATDYCCEEHHWLYLVLLSFLWFLYFYDFFRIFTFSVTFAVTFHIFYFFYTELSRTYVLLGNLFYTELFIYFTSTCTSMYVLVR